VHLKPPGATESDAAGLVFDTCALSRNSLLELARRRSPGGLSELRRCSCDHRTSRSLGPAWPGSRAAVTCGSAALRTWRTRTPGGKKPQNTITVIVNVTSIESENKKSWINYWMDCIFHSKKLFKRKEKLSRDFPSDLKRSVSLKQPPLLYLQHLGEERHHADHDEEQADAIDLLPLKRGIYDGECLHRERERTETC